MTARVKLRLTKIVCPSCDGVGTCGLLGIRCQWCKGYKRITVPVATDYFRHCEMLAIGGYIMGDHGWEYRCDELGRIAEIRAFLAQETSNG